MTLRLLIVPDKFKGTFSSSEVAEAIERGFRSVFPQLIAKVHPLADGGEGSSSVVGKQLSATKIQRAVTGPEGREVQGFYYLSGTKAFVELAAASGLTLVRSKSNPLGRTTYGFGELIKDAIERGATDITLFLGGSATTDGGVGMAAALGVQFNDDRGNPVISKERLHDGVDLGRIRTVNWDKAVFKSVKIQAACDVTNPLTGERGAAAVFGPQKGLSEVERAEADARLRRLAEIVKTAKGAAFTSAASEGCGAAGGCGFGVLNLLDGKLVSGSEYFLDLIEFDKLLPTVDLVVTGEGKLDEQSLSGKLVGKILERCPERPVSVFCGVVDLSPERVSHFPNLIPFGLGTADSWLKNESALAALAQRVGKLLQL